MAELTVDERLTYLSKIRTELTKAFVCLNNGDLSGYKANIAEATGDLVLLEDIELGLIEKTNNG